MSGIYIKGMELPEPGKVRQVVIASDGRCYKTIYQAAMAVSSFAKAIPVPDHNGDLIGREWMREAFYRYAKTGGVLYDLADEAPTIIPEDKEE